MKVENTVSGGGPAVLVLYCLGANLASHSPQMSTKGHVLYKSAYIRMRARNSVLF